MKNILDALKWRYAVKAFDSTKKISDQDLSTIKESLVLTPSSYGLQPWKFLVITNDEIRAKLRPHSWNQSQITDCSHLVVLCRKTDMTEEHVDAYLADMAETQNTPIENYEGYRNMMIQNVVEGMQKTDKPAWMKNQVYIALGNLMTVCAAMEIDTCPIEGFDPAEYDKILGLADKGLASCVVCPIGYRSDDDAHQNDAKVRFSVEQMIETIS